MIFCNLTAKSGSSGVAQLPHGHFTLEKISLEVPQLDHACYAWLSTKSSTGNRGRGQGNLRGGTFWGGGMSLVGQVV